MSRSAPQALLFLLAVTATLAAVGRRRSPVAAAPVAELPMPPEFHPIDAPARPAVDAFEGIVAGRSALLRVHADVADRSGAVLVVDSGDDADLLTALPDPAGRGALGFACAREIVERGAHYWLSADGANVALGSPALRTV